MKKTSNESIDVKEFLASIEGDFKYKYMEAFIHAEKVLKYPLHAMDEDGQIALIRSVRRYPKLVRFNYLVAYESYVSWLNKRRDESAVNLFGLTKQHTRVVVEEYTILTKRHVHTFLRNVSNEHEQVAFALVYYCGLRAEELHNLQSEDIRGDQFMILRRGRPHVSGLPPRYHTILRKIAASVKGAIFPQRMTRELSTRYLNERIRQDILKGSKLSDVWVSGVYEHYCSSFGNTRTIYEYANMDIKDLLPLFKTRQAKTYIDTLRLRW